MADYIRLDAVSSGQGKIGLKTVQPGCAVRGPVVAARECGVVRNGLRCTALIRVSERACAVCRAALVAELERLAGSCADGESEG